MKTLFLSGWATPPSLFKNLLPKECELIDITKIISQFSTIDKIVDYLSTKLDDSTHLVGWSTGATIALAIAQRVPLTKVTLFAPTASFLEDENGVGVSKAALKSLKRLVKRDRNSAMKKFFKSCGFEDGNDFSTEYTTDELLQGLEFLKDTIVDLKPVQFEVNLFHSKDDLIIPLESAELVSKKLNVPLTLIKGGHKSIINQLSSTHL
jgi:esterase/lipase